MKPGRNSLAPATGLVVGMVLAVLVLVLRAPDDAAPRPPERTLPAAPDSAAHAAELGATYFGRGSDGASVALWVTPRKWSWWVVSPHHRGCGSAEVARAFHMTKVWAAPQGERHFYSTATWANPILLDGRRRTDRVTAWVNARPAGNGRLRGSFSRTDVFEARGVVSRGCDQRFNFELRPV